MFYSTRHKFEYKVPKSLVKMQSNPQVHGGNRDFVSLGCSQQHEPAVPRKLQYIHTKFWSQMSMAALFVDALEVKGIYLDWIIFFSHLCTKIPVWFSFHDLIARFIRVLNNVCLSRRVRVYPYLTSTLPKDTWLLPGLHSHKQGRLL